MKPAILSVASSPLGGLVVHARFACGHEQTSIFPHAPRRSSRQEIRGWLFGSCPEDELCSRCAREARSRAAASEHDCRYAGEPEAGPFPFCEECA